MDKRLEDYRSDTEDPELVALMARFGRYLLISSSRPGSLPANLQGLWNPDRVYAPWGADYHLNINLQMNCWQTGPGNLYFHYPHYRSTVPHSAIITGSFKVLHFYAEPNIPILIDLSKDIGEVSNIAQQNRETHKKLFDEMMRYLKAVGARFPKINLRYDPEEYRKDKKTDYRIKWGPFEGQRTLDDDEIQAI